MGTNIKIQGMEQAELQPLQRKNAKKLLQLSLRPIDVTKAQCKILLDMTGEVPLAIRLVSSAVKSGGLDGVSDDMLKPLLNAQLQNEMKDCIEYSFRYLKESEKVQLQFLSVVETTHFDIEIVKAVLEIENQEALFLMMKLTNKQLVQRVQTGQNSMQYCFHPLIFEYMHNRMIHEEFSLKAQNNFCKHMLEWIEPHLVNADKNYHEVMTKVKGNQPLLKVFFNVLSTRKDDRNNLLTTTRNRYLSKLQEMLQMTKLENEQLFKNLSEQTRNNQRKHAFVFWKLEEIQMMVDRKRLSEAENEIPVLEQIIFDEINDKEPSAYLRGRFWYVKGRVFRCKRQKQPHEAIKCFKTSLDIYHNVQNIPESSMALDALGNAYFDSGDYDNALFYHKQAADMLRDFVHGQIHPDIAAYEFNVGTIYLEKARRAISIYKRVTEETCLNLRQALELFKDSMAKNVQMGTDRRPEFADMLFNKAYTLYYLNQYEEAIIDLKRSLEIKVKSPDKNITLEYFIIGKTFLVWRRDIPTESHMATAKLLLKEAVYCFQKAEDEIRSDGRASLTGTDKSEFIRLYRRIANGVFVKRDTARIIRSFCERFERHVTFDSSSSSGSTDNSETSSPSSQENSDSDEGIQSENNETDQAAAPLQGIPCVESQKQDALQFEKEFLSKIKAQITEYDGKKRRLSSSERD